MIFVLQDNKTSICDNKNRVHSQQDYAENVRGILLLHP